MTAQELYKEVCDDAGHQLTQVFLDMSPNVFEARVSPAQMTPKETAVHLTEAYVAGLKHLNDEKHEWGSYESVASDQVGILQELFTQRTAFVEKSLQMGTEDALKTGTSYASGHDFYHIGQLCTIRIANEPEWNPYSIYRS